MALNSDFWEIPRLWPESTVFIIGGGPSLLQVDLSIIHDQRIVGVNQAYTLGPWVDVLWFGDKKWYPSQIPQIREYGGLIITCAVESQTKRRWKRVKYLGRSKQYGIEHKRRTHIAWNQNSGASAINIAYHLGAKRVVLLGFDQRLPKDEGEETKTHWHRDYELMRDRRTGKLVDPYSRFMKAWKPIYSDANRLGLEILNASPGSAIDLFPMVELEDVL